MEYDTEYRQSYRWQTSSLQAARAQDAAASSRLPSPERRLQLYHEAIAHSRATSPVRSSFPTSAIPPAAAVTAQYPSPPRVQQATTAYEQVYSPQLSPQQRILGVRDYAAAATPAVISTTPAVGTVQTHVLPSTILQPAPTMPTAAALAGTSAPPLPIVEAGSPVRLYSPTLKATPDTSPFRPTAWGLSSPVKEQRVQPVGGNAREGQALGVTDYTPSAPPRPPSVITSIAAQRSPSPFSQQQRQQLQPQQQQQQDVNPYARGPVYARNDIVAPNPKVTAAPYVPPQPLSPGGVQRLAAGLPSDHAAQRHASPQAYATVPVPKLSAEKPDLSSLPLPPTSRPLFQTFPSRPPSPSKEEKQAAYQDRSRGKQMLPYGWAHRTLPGTEGDMTTFNVDVPPKQVEPATRTHLAASQALHKHEEEENTRRRQAALQAEFYRQHPQSRNGVYDAMHPYVPSTQVEVQYLPDQLAKYLKATRLVDQTWNTEYRRVFKDHITPKKSRPTSSRGAKPPLLLEEQTKTDLRAKVPYSKAALANEKAEAAAAQAKRSAVPSTPVAPKLHTVRTKVAHPAPRANDLDEASNGFRSVRREYVATPTAKPIWKPTRQTISSGAPVGGQRAASQVASWGALPAGVRFMAGDSVRHVLK